MQVFIALVPEIHTSGLPSQAALPPCLGDTHPMGSLRFPCPGFTEVCGGIWARLSKTLHGSVGL